MPIPTLTFHANITGTQNISALGGAVTVGAQSQNEHIVFQHQNMLNGLPNALEAIDLQASDLFSNLSLPNGSVATNSLAETVDLAIPINFAHYWF